MLYQAASEVQAAALAYTPKQLAADGLDEFCLGIAHHQLGAIEASIHQSGDELSPEGLTLALTHLVDKPFSQELPSKSRRTSSLTPTAMTTAMEKTCLVLSSRPLK
jgi:hypothetical protein